MNKKTPPSLRMAFIPLMALIVLMALLPFSSFAAENLITDAGREVIINDDGSWNFVSDDRFATNTEGERIRLKADGSWEILGVDENLTTAHSAVYRNSPEYEAVTFMLNQVVIESTRSKATVSSKNTHIKSQTAFHVLIAVPDSESEAFVLEPSFADFFSVFDSASKNYPLLSIAPSSLSIAPGEEKSIIVRVDGAPAWKYGKSYDFKVSADFMPSGRELVIAYPLSKTKKIEVESFPE